VATPGARFEFDGLNVFIENEDWVAIEGTPNDFEKLAAQLMELAKDTQDKCRIFDGDPPSFQNGSLGLTFYRRPK